MNIITQNAQKANLMNEDVILKKLYELYGDNYYLVTHDETAALTVLEEIYYYGTSFYRVVYQDLSFEELYNELFHTSIIE